MPGHHRALAKPAGRLLSLLTQSGAGAGRASAIASRNSSEVTTSPVSARIIEFERFTTSVPIGKVRMYITHPTSAAAADPQGPRSARATANMASDADDAGVGGYA